VINITRFTLWTPEELERAFPVPKSAKPNGAGASEAQRGGRADIDEASLPDDLLGWIQDGVPQPGDRSRVFMLVVAELKRLGFTFEGVYRLLDRYPDGIAQKYKTARDRLRREVERAYDKVDASASPLPLPVLSPPAAPAGSSRTPQLLAETHATFKRWLGEKYDTGLLDAVASAAAAERLGGDPLWLMVIAGSGGTKTETVRALKGAGALAVSTISSEGALLSATARSRGATGGLLHRIGARGLLVIKDFTSILSADRNVRNAVLAALREIHDGEWQRHVGFAGGRTLSWVGRIVVIAACTTAWDAAHSVIATMGDRFVVVRGDTTVGREEAALRAIGNTGSEDAIRAELAASLGALVASVDMAVRDLTAAETDQLVKLANIVTWARTGVERDYRGEVIDAHAREMPTRFAKQLAQATRGALSIGVPAEIAMQQAVRCARDSLDPLRRDLLLDVAAHPDSDPSGVHARMARPLTTVRTNLTALHVLRLLTCEEREEWRGRRPFLVPHYRLSPEVDRATLLKM
jgi:hypothetical protein